MHEQLTGGVVAELDRMLAALRARIAAFTHHQDSSKILEGSALDEAARLWQLAQSASADGKLPVVVGQQLALLHWCRSLALPEDDGEEDYRQAIKLFAALFKVDPALVPEQLHAAVDDDPAHRFTYLQRIIDDPVALNDSIDHLRGKVTVTPSDHPAHAGYLSSLCFGLRTRYERTGDLADLDEAIDAGRQAVAATSPDHPNRATYLSNLSVALGMRYERTGELSYLDQAIDGIRKALAATTPDRLDQAVDMANLGVALGHRFDRTGELSDLDQAIDALHDALAATPPDHPHHAIYLSNLGASLRTRYERTGNLVDLNRAIDTFNDALAATTPDQPFYQDIQSNLAGALGIRSQRLGELVDLNSAVNLFRAALAATPPDHLDHAIRLSNLGVALRQRFDRTGELSDLDQAIDALHDALAATPPDHPDHAIRLSNLGVALRQRFERTGDPTDLDQAIDIGHRAVAASPPHYPHRDAILADLGIALRSRFTRSNLLTDLDAAIDALREAVIATRPDEPKRTAILVNLGGAHQARFERSRALEDAAAAIGWYQEAATMQTGAPSDRLPAAISWARLAASLNDRWPDAADGYAMAVELLPLLAWQGLDRADREQLLGDWPLLASDAAAAAVMAGRPERAIELLEQGRSVLWSQLLETRTDLLALGEVAPELAAQLREVRTALDETGPASTNLIVDAVAADARSAYVADKRIRLAHKWDDLVVQVRALGGEFTNFLRPPTAHQLRAAATGGSVVVVNVSQWRSDALIVTTKGIQVLPLPTLTLDLLVNQSYHYLRALHEFESGRHDPTAWIILEQAISSTLEWIWDAIVEPVLISLGHTETPSGQRWPRVWWCPTGPLTLLPVHAAGYHGSDQPAGRSVLDRVISSYTPTLRALLHAREASTNPLPNKHQRLLLIAMPKTPGHPALPNVERECRLLTGLFPGTRHRLLNGSDATRTAVSNALADHGWVHFSCHGEQDLVNPSEGGIVLNDGTLTITDITASLASRGEFAFLSVCKAHTGGIRVADEAITLASGLQYIGWQHVIATLWSVWDASAADVTEHVYPRLVEDGRLNSRHAAEALHHAIRQLRDANPYRPSRWVPFLHAGP
jgi:hypothetical protein